MFYLLTQVIGTHRVVMLFLSFCTSELFHNNLLESRDSEVPKNFNFSICSGILKF